MSTIFAFMYQFVFQWPIKRGAVRCHIKSFSINLPLNFPFKEGELTGCEAHFVKAAKEKAFPHI